MILPDETELLPEFVAHLQSHEAFLKQVALDAARNRKETAEVNIWIAEHPVNEENQSQDEI